MLHADNFLTSFGASLFLIVVIVTIGYLNPVAFLFKKFEEIVYCAGNQRKRPNMRFQLRSELTLLSTTQAVYCTFSLYLTSGNSI